MKNTQYKRGVLEFVSRAQAINPEIGNYQEHKPSGPDHFQITVSNGTFILPRLVAHSQQEFPARVSDEWVAEIANTFEKSSTEARKHPGFLERIFSSLRRSS